MTVSPTAITRATKAELAVPVLAAAARLASAAHHDLPQLPHTGMPPVLQERRLLLLPARRGGAAAPMQHRTRAVVPAPPKQRIGVGSPRGTDHGHAREIGVVRQVIEHFLEQNRLQEHLGHCTNCDEPTTGATPCPDSGRRRHKPHRRHNGVMAAGAACAIYCSGARAVCRLSAARLAPGLRCTAAVAVLKRAAFACYSALAGHKGSSPREITRPPKYLQHWNPINLLLDQTKSVRMD